MSEIKILDEQIRERLSRQHKLSIFTLHSLLDKGHHSKVFDKPPTGHRKIIISTAIAETSVTIDDVTRVLDIGFIKEADYDDKLNATQLVRTWVSKANAKQRRGRAGRVKEGKVYRFYSRVRHDFLMSDFQVPEIKREALDSLILKLYYLDLHRYNMAELENSQKTYSDDGDDNDGDDSDLEIIGENSEIDCQIIEEIKNPVKTLLSHCLDAPNSKKIDSAIFKLDTMKAISKTHNLITPLGILLTRFGVDPEIGRMLFYACLFGVFDSVSAVAAALSNKSPFSKVPDFKRDQAKRMRIALDPGSDMMAMSKIYYQFLKMDRAGQSYDLIRDWAWDNFLSFDALRSMQRSIYDFENRLKNWVRGVFFSFFI